MARCNEAIPLSPVSTGRCPGPYTPAGSASGMGTISPVISVSSVNGESGDIVLKNLVVGEKVYNGSNEVHIYANDLGLEKAVVYKGRYLTKDALTPVLAQAEVGDLFFCAEDKLFYLSVGEGDAKCFISDKALEDFDKVSVPAKVEMELDEESFELTTKLFNSKDELLYESFPIKLPHEVKDIIKEGYYDAETNEIVFVLYNDEEIRVTLEGIIDEFQPKITDDNKLSMALVEGLPEFRAETNSRLSNEATTRAAADSAETDSRVAADLEEKEARETADQELRDAINEEAQNRIDADTQLAADLATESHRREVADISLSDRVDTTEAGILDLGSDLLSESVTRENEDNNIWEALNHEIERAINTEIDINSRLNEEHSARTLVDGQLADRISAEENARRAKDIAIDDAIGEANAARQAADDVLTNMISAEQGLRISADADERSAREQADLEVKQLLVDETNRALNVENTLQSNITAEETARIQKDNELVSAINLESNNRALVDGQLSDAISAEAQSRAEADNALHDEIATLPFYEIERTGETTESIAVYHLMKTFPVSGEKVECGAPIAIPKDFVVKDAQLKEVTQVDVPYEGAQVGDKYIDLIINVNTGGVAGSKHIYIPVNDLVDVYTGGNGINVINNVIGIKPEITNEIAQLRSDLSDEVTHRTDADSHLSDDITHEINNRAAADIELQSNLDTAIANEQVAREQADATLQNNLDTAIGIEQNTRASEDERIETTLDTKIDTEISDRETAVADEQSARELADNAEETARKAADKQLGEAIGDLTSRLSAEKENRISADNSLQEQINNISARRTSYATTIVGTGDQNVFQIFHDLGTMDVIFQIFDVTDGKMVLLDNQRIDANEIDISFNTAPLAGHQYRVLCQSIDSDVTVNYEANGGEGTMPIELKVKGKPASLSACRFTAPEGYQFKAWAINSIEGEQVEPPTPYTFNDDTTAYAIWEVIPTEANVFYGLVPDTMTPTSVEGLNETYVSRADLLNNGLELNFITDEQRFVIAIKKSLGVALDDIKYVAGGEEWHLGFLTYETEDEIIYYDEDGSTSYGYEWRFVCSFRSTIEEK